MREVRRYRVFGMVQGVGYRAFVWRAAAGLGLAGWVRNRYDGSVEVLAAGSAEELDMLADRLRHGPRFAKVAAVEFTTELETTEVGNSFGFRRDE